MDPAASASLTAESFSMVALFMRADWVIKAVMIGLALASLFSWAVIIDKLVRFGALNRHANRFEDQVSSGRSLEEIASEAGDRPRHALPRMLQAALREWREARTKGLSSDSQAGFLIQRIDRVLDAIIARESARVEEGLPLLAIVATASPFVGLFGTVWGIMNAFRGLAQVQQATLATVAPGIAEALIATAIGLFAAIPAVIAYNRFTSRGEMLIGRYYTFADEFQAILHRKVHTRDD